VNRQNIPGLPGLFIPPDPLLGATLAGKYKIERLLGQGGMGSVYVATQLAVNRPVAVKVLRPVPGVSEAQLVERFKREALATSTLHHPNTVQVIDFGQHDHAPGHHMLYLVLELLKGGTLTRLLKAEAPLAPERVAAIGKQIAKSLAEAHDLGIVHRDLKPDNVFICDYDHDPDFVKVMDFGIARLLTTDEHVTRTGMMIGTPRYMAPEQAMAKKVSPSADIYSLGVILYEMLTGAPPFSADSSMALALAHINEPPPPLLLPGYPEPQANAWRGLVAALLTKNHEARPQKASQVAQWLQQLEYDARRNEPRNPTPVPTPAPAATPGYDPATYSGPTSRQNITVEQAMRARQGPSKVVVWTAAALFMLLGGIVAFLLLRP